MSALERTSRKGRKQRPKVEAATILEALYSIGQPGTIMDVAAKAGVSRNTASDRLLELSEGGFFVARAKDTLPTTGGPRPWVFTITQNGINAVLQLRAKRERLASEVDPETQGERFDRAAQILEAEAEAIEAKLAGGTGIDPRQLTIEQAVAHG